MTEPIKITLDLAKELCSDFDLVKRKDLGKSACISLMRDGEMCTRGNHFVCELVLYKLRAKAKEERGDRHAVSAGRINLLDSCARKYHLVIEQSLSSPAGEPVFTRIANAFHVARAKLDLGHPFEPRDLRADLPPVEAAKLRAALRFYMEQPPYPAGSVSCEDHCQFEFEGTWFGGRADLSENGSTIFEWRYVQNSVAAMQVARQAAVFLKGFPTAERYRVYRVRKPSYRPKRTGETMRDFEQRILEGMRKDGPKKVYSTTTVERDHLDVDGVLREMKRSFEVVLPAMREAGMPPNYASCELCDYQTVCGEMLGQTTDEIANRLLADKEG